jgi:hypothetical protein
VELESTPSPQASGTRTYSTRLVFIDLGKPNPKLRIVPRIRFVVRFENTEIHERGRCEVLDNDKLILSLGKCQWEQAWAEGGKLATADEVRQIRKMGWRLDLSELLRGQKRGVALTWPILVGLKA